MATVRQARESSTLRHLDAVNSRTVAERWNRHPSPAVRAAVAQWDETTRLALGLAVFAGCRTAAIARVTGLAPDQVLPLLRARLAELGRLTRTIGPLDS